MFISNIGQESLEREHQKERITDKTLEYLHRCLQVMEENAVYVSTSLLVFGAVNIALDFLLLVGSCCRMR